MITLINFILKNAKKGTSDMGTQLLERNEKIKAAGISDSFDSSPLSSLHAAIEDGFTVKHYSEISAELQKRTLEAIRDIKGE